MLHALLDLVLPDPCAGCGGPAGPLCGPCAGALHGAATRTRPDPCPAGFPTCWAVGPYDGPLRSVLLAYKERGRSGLAGPLGGALAGAAAAAAAPTRPVVLVPVPSQPAAARARGGDHVRRLAAVAATHLSAAGRSVRVVPALRCTAAVRDSAGLSAAERAENLAGAYTLHPPAAHRLRADDAPVVVLVDDLVTTGATLQVAAQTLRGLRLGAQITAAVIGATQRRRPSCAIRGLGQGRVNG